MREQGGERGQTPFSRHEWKIAACAHLLLLHICFFPLIWGNGNLLQAATSVPSIMPAGAYQEKQGAVPKFFPVNDAGASAWQSEAWFSLLHKQLWEQHTLPLWNPSQGYGRPLFANMQSQPFYPLTTLLSLKPSPRTFNWYLLARLLIAGLCGFGFLRKLVSFVPALAGSIACMLGGYLILFINQPHLSVETLYPAALWTGERLVENPSIRSMTWFAAIILFVFLGGMPESAFLLFLFVYSYLGLRIFSQRLAPRRRQLAYVAGATVAGLALSAFLLFPFFEFVQRAFTVHQPFMFRGLEHDAASFSFLGYLLPLGFCRPGAIEDLRNYVGFIGMFLMIAAFAVQPALKHISYFAWAGVLIVPLKRYGMPVLNQVGQLPLFRQVDLTKYEEPILSFSAAILIALGLEALRAKRAGTRMQWVAIVALAVILPLCWLTAPAVIALQTSKPLPQMQIYAYVFATLLLIACSVCVWRKSVAGLAALLAIEFAGNYILPAYRFFGETAKRTQNPYRGAPYISFLKDRAGTDRIFAENGLLTPDWASAFGLYDIRDLDALYIDRYFPFLKLFFRNPEKLAPDLESRFRGWDIYTFSSPLERRLLQLSSVRYIASLAAIPNENKVVEAILSQNAGKAISIMPNNKVGDEFPETLMEHPPFDRLPYECKVPEKEAQFHYSYGITQSAWNKPGDGVGFTLEVRTPQGAIRKIFHQYIDPKHNPADRKWFDGTVDLAEFAGKTVTLLYSTDPGPAGDTSYDWAGWAHLGFQNEPSSSQFRLIYDKEAMVFQYQDPLPRASIFYRAELLTGDRAVQQELGAPSFDPFHSVLLNSSELDAGTRAQVARMNSDTAVRAETAHIVSNEARQVEIEAELLQPGILMLNDSGFPGWEVSTDGKQSKWFPADYLFRGVFLAAGKHHVTFSYRPGSFYWGGVLSLASALTLLVALRWKHAA